MITGEIHKQGNICVSLKALSPECFTPYVSFPSSATGANTQVTFGCHFANSCYTCKATPSAAFQQSGMSHGANGNVGGHSADKQDTAGFGRAALRCGEVPGRVRDLGVYQGYTVPYSYPRIPGYIDVPVAQRARTRDQRRESPFAVEGYQPWNWSSSWSGQVYCPKEQTQSSHIWKSSLAGKICSLTHISPPLISQGQIGRASCRERVSPPVDISVDAGSLKKNTNHTYII